ncbi:hypothetical protein ACFL2T_07780 [Elusimicrobiota bacterium]
MAKNGKKLGVGVTLTTLAAAGAYFLYGKGGDKRRKEIKGWALKMKGDVLEKLEKSKVLDKKKYYDLVDKVTKRYKKIKKVSGPEIKKINKDLKGAWTKIKKELA